jgi:hypothetical protein
MSCLAIIAFGESFRRLRQSNLARSVLRTRLSEDFLLFSLAIIRVGDQMRVRHGSDREYVVEVPDSLADELIADFILGPIVQEPDIRLLEEQTINRFNGLKIQIFSKEHPPPHFRVAFQSSFANFAISDCSMLAGSGEIIKYRKNILQWWRKNKENLIRIWNETRPSDCPVGEYRE